MPNLDVVEASITKLFHGRRLAQRIRAHLLHWDATAQGVWFANTESVGHFILYCYSTIKYPTENDYSLEVFNGDDVGSELLDSLPVDGLIKGARVDSVGECETRDGVELEAVVAGVGCDSVLSVGCKFILQRSAESQQSVV